MLGQCRKSASFVLGPNAYSESFYPLWIPLKNRFSSRHDVMYRQQRAFIASTSMMRVSLNKRILGENSKINDTLFWSSYQLLNSYNLRWHFLTSNQIRLASTDRPSAVEQTLQMLREDLKNERRKEVEREKAAALLKTKTGEGGQKSLSLIGNIHSLWLRFWAELKHYWHGFRLLALDIRLALKYSWRILSGESLNRRERRQLVRTVGDMFRLVPFSIFLIVPFMEFLLPFFIKFFPNMLPSTFQEASKEEEKIRKQLKVRLEMAKFLQDTLENISLEKRNLVSDDQTATSKAKEFVDFMRAVRNQGGYVSNTELFAFSKLFEDELTLENLPVPQLRALCRMLLIRPIGTPNVLRFQLNVKLRELKADDRQISSEGGVDVLTVPELQQACRARGMRALGVSEERLRAQLKQWLELSLDDKVPPALLLMSRALYLPEDISFIDRLKTLLSSLPDPIAEQTRQRLTEMEGGTVDYLDRLEMIKNIEEAIAVERDEAEKRVETEIKLKHDEKLAPELTLATTADKMMAESVKDKEKKEETRESKTITHEDLQQIEDILYETSGGALSEEKHDVAELKEQVMEHVEDLKQVDVLDVAMREKKVARQLRGRVNSIISNLDTLIGQLSVEKRSLKEQLVDPAIQGSEQQQKDNLVRIDDLLSSLSRLQTVGDKSKQKHIETVLKAMDDDTDGKVDVNLALEVIELLAQDTELKISPVEMGKIIEMLRKEDALDAMEKGGYSG